MIAALRSVIQAALPGKPQKNKSKFLVPGRSGNRHMEKGRSIPLELQRRHDFHDRLWRRKGSPRPNGKAR
jgi:hypothetical protein